VVGLLVAQLECVNIFTTTRFHTSRFLDNRLSAIDLNILNHA